MTALEFRALGRAKTLARQWHRAQCRGRDFAFTNPSTPGYSTAKLQLPRTNAISVKEADAS